MTPLARLLEAQLHGVGFAAEMGPAAQSGVGYGAKPCARRREEFLAGRRCAARALATAGCRDGSCVGSGPDGTPSWPRGFTGSIAHASGCCVSVAAPSDLWPGLGVDCELDRPLEAEARRLVLTRDEKARIAALDAGAARLFNWCTIFFCIKEAVYKGGSAHDPELFEFADVEVRASALGTFTARCGTAAAGSAVGCFGFVGNHIVVVAGYSGPVNPAGRAAAP